MGKLLVLIVTAMLDMMGVLIVVPLLPFYAERLGASPLVYSMLVSSFSFAALLSAPIWGRFSDRYGRRPALLIALGASAVAYVVFAYADSLLLLFVSRIVQGAGGGTVGVIQAYVSDATEPKNRARSLGWLSAATNVGVAIGPVIGGWSVRWGHQAPGLVAAVLCLVNMAFAYYYLRESHDVVAAKARPRVPGRALQAVVRVISHPNEPAARLIWIYAISIGAFMGVMAMLALYLAHTFGVNEQNIGLFFTYTAIISVLSRAVVLGPLVDRLGEAKLSRLGIVLLATGLALTPFARTIPLLALTVGLIPIGTAFTFPCVTALLSRVIASHERGLYMGVQQSFGGVSRVLFPIFMGFTFQSLGPSYPFWIAAGFVVATLALGLGMDSYARDAEPVTPAAPEVT